MTPVDAWAASAAAIAAGALALRGNMLKPHHGAWALAPTPVWAGLLALSIALGMSAVSIAQGAHATAREAMVYTVLAAVAVVMAWNLHRHGRAGMLAQLHNRMGVLTTVEARDASGLTALGREVRNRERKS